MLMTEYCIYFENEYDLDRNACLEITYPSIILYWPNLFNDVAHRFL